MAKEKNEQDTSPLAEVPDKLPEEEGQPSEQKPFDVSELSGGKIGYTPLPNNVPAEPEGSVWKANFFSEHTIGAFFASPTSGELTDEVDRELNFVDHIPDDLKLEHADKFVGRKIEDFPDIASHIREEEERKALLRAHPWQSFAVGAAEGVVDPASWLPMGALYRNVKHGTSLARTIIGSGMAGVAGATAQEAVLNREQLTREATESFANIAASGILAGAMGGIGYGLKEGFQGKAIFASRQRAHKEIVDTLTEQDKKLDANDILRKEDLFNIPPIFRKAMSITPMNRLLNSSFGVSKWFANSMYQHGYRLNKDLALETDGQDIETLIRLDKGKVRSMTVEHQNIYFDMVGVGRGPFKGTRAKLANIDMSMDQFDKAVWRTISTQIDHSRPDVNKAARMWEDKLIKPTREKAIELGFLTEDQWPRNAPGYITQLYKRDLIIERGGRSARGPGTFGRFLFDKFTEIQGEIKRFKESPEFRRLNTSIEKQNASLKKLNAQKKKTPKSKKEQIKKINERIEAENERLKKLKKEFREKAPKRGLNEDGELFGVFDEPTLWAHVEQTIDHILGDTDGKLVNPILTKIKSSQAKPLMRRKMTIEQEAMEEWSVTDIPKIMDTYSRAMHPLIRLTELAKKNGAEDIQGFRKMLSDQLTAEFNEQSKGKTGAAAQKLRRQLESNIKDMNATFELLEGVYGDGPNTLNNGAQKFYQNFLKWNYVRLLGYMTISSLADAGMQVFVHGPYRFIHEGLVDSFSEARKISNRDAAAIGYGIETELGSRIQSWTDTQGLSVDPGPFTKGLDVATQGMGNLSAMNQWNGWQQRMAAHIGINRTLNTIHKFVKGEKVSQKELERVVRNGLDRKHWQTIFDYTKENIADNGVHYADWTNWNINTAAQREALEQFQGSIAKEIDNIVIVPGLGDKPLFAHTPAGKLLFQFKTFAMATTNRVLYSGLQRRDDINMYLGVTSMLGLGALSYMITSFFKGKEPDLSFSNLSKEAFDRSGVLGLFGEVGNTGSKLLGFGGVSRYQTRDRWGALSGPTGGAISEVLDLINKTGGAIKGDDEITTKDAQKVRRLAVYQNLFYLDRINRYLTRNTALALGATDVD